MIDQYKSNNKKTLKILLRKLIRHCPPDHAITSTNFVGNQEEMLISFVTVKSSKA